MYPETTFVDFELYLFIYLFLPPLDSTEDILLLISPTTSDYVSKKHNLIDARQIFLLVSFMLPIFFFFLITIALPG